MANQHQDIFDLLEEYVSGTLSPAKRRAVESHLDEGCSECQGRLAELGDLAAQMADALPQHEPPVDLKQKILQSVANPSATGRDDTDDSTASPAEPELPSSSLVRVVFAVAAAAIVVLSFWNWQMYNELDNIRGRLAASEAETERLNRELATYQDATFLLAEPGMQFIDLAGVAPNEQAFGKVVIDPERGQGVVYMYELPPTPDGMAYQLWIVREGQPTSVGTFTVNDDGSAMLSLETLPELREIASFEVTIEPAGGEEQPTGMMYLTGPSVFQSPER